MTTHLHQSSSRLTRLSHLHQELQTVVNRPLWTGNPVRWHYTHNSMNWFREQKRVVHHYNWNCGAEARHEDGPYAESHMDYTDWKVNKHSAILLYFAATLYNDVEGTLYE